MYLTRIYISFLPSCFSWVSLETCWQLLIETLFLSTTGISSSLLSFGNKFLFPKCRTNCICYCWTTLTTGMPANSGFDHKFTNDKMPNASLNSQTVECRLKRTYERLAETEANVQLFIRLKNMGLATNDVSSFARKQTIHQMSWCQSPESIHAK